MTSRRAPRGVGRRIATWSLLSSLLVLFAFGPAATALADPPPGYYDSTVGLSGNPLRLALRNVIDGHTSLSYNAAKNQLWTNVENRGGFVIDLYSGRTSTSLDPDTDGMNTEHTWPQSRGAEVPPPESDLHHLYIVDATWNSRRGSFIFTEVVNSTATSPIGARFNSSEGFEPPDLYKGDIARAILYFHVRYALDLADNVPLTGTDASPLDDNMGKLTDILAWNEADPPDAHERTRNDRVFALQGNRNPFIDDPDFACRIFVGATCGEPDTTPPNTPTGLNATGAAGAISLTWNANSEGDLAGYRLYRSASNAGPYVTINDGAIVSGTSFSDTPVIDGVPVFYKILAEDVSGNRSALSASDNATASPGGTGGTGDPWINEFHYDNDGADVGESVEIAGPAGLALAGWKLYGYNGSGGANYATVDLSGTLSNLGGCLGVANFAFEGLQNGAPDGIALVSPQGNVVEFLSYEGSFTGTAGPANGILSTDIGILEVGTTPIGQSLQRTGTGIRGSDFTWTGPVDDTPGAINSGQSFGNACGGPAVLPVPPTGLGATTTNTAVTLNWTASVSEDLTLYRIYRGSSATGTFAELAEINAALTTYQNTGLDTGTTYYYTVTAISAEGESLPSASVSATPGTTPSTSTGVLMR